MKIFLDTANLAQIRDAHAAGLLDGITTNPSLMAKEGVRGTEAFRGHIRKICEIVNGPISAECVTVTAEAMVREGRELAAIHPNVVVKVPLITEGLSACRQLRQAGIKVNVTLCFSAVQAMLAAKAGATYISPFIGRLDDIGQVGMDLIRDIKAIYANYGFRTEILVASVRHPVHVLEAARVGADIATMPFAVFEQLVKHPLTEIGQARFLKDWGSAA
ncbi:MAG: fructose-6-phosphate aldolase [Candidatus Omnitrophica bacterium]|nr:fructose-6-phosphate aldolase [Candidatus Omnitrophota bacterium]